MDAEQILGVLVSILLCLVIGGLFFGVIFDALITGPHRADDAQRICESKGFDIYTRYAGFLRSKAYGVRCDYVDYTRKQIDIDLTEAVPAVVS